MKILADENIDPPLIGWPRAAGHEVISIRETAKGCEDSKVLDLAVVESCILLTADKDFGQLVFRQGLPCCGIILLRLRARSIEELLWLFRSFWPQMEKGAAGNFLVATNQALRIRPLLAQ